MTTVLSHAKKTYARQSKLESSSGYADNCGTGFNKANYSQAHHILCKTCIGNRKSGYPKGKDLVDYLEACLWATKWNIDASHNLVGLPVNKQYRDTDGKTPVNIPSHQVDHNTRGGYTDEVSSYLKENVWNSLSAKKKVHAVDLANLKAELESASDEFRSRLLVRFGARNGGTRVCWKNRFDPSYKKKWYRPFSMATKPEHRSAGSPGVRMKGIFKKLT